MAADGRFRNPGLPGPRSQSTKAQNTKALGSRPLGDLLSGILDPVLRKRAGITLSLLQSWEEVVGPFAASRSRPDKLSWPRGRSQDVAGAATLVIACEPSAALELQHETTEIMARVNAFLGFAAVGKIRFIQKPVSADAGRSKPKPRTLTNREKEAIRRLTDRIEDDGLRASLERLGASVKGTRRSNG